MADATAAVAQLEMGRDRPAAARPAFTVSDAHAGTCEHPGRDGEARDRVACMFGIYCGCVHSCDLLAVLRRYIKRTRVLDTHGSL